MSEVFRDAEAMSSFDEDDEGSINSGDRAHANYAEKNNNVDDDEEEEELLKIQNVDDDDDEEEGDDDKALSQKERPLSSATQHSKNSAQSVTRSSSSSSPPSSLHSASSKSSPPSSSKSSSPSSSPPSPSSSSSSSLSLSSKTRNAITPDRERSAKETQDEVLQEGHESNGIVNDACAETAGDKKREEEEKNNHMSGEDEGRKDSLRGPDLAVSDKEDRRSERSKGDSTIPSEDSQDSGKI